EPPVAVRASEADDGSLHRPSAVCAPRSGRRVDQTTRPRAAAPATGAHGRASWAEPGSAHDAVDVRYRWQVWREDGVDQPSAGPDPEPVLLDIGDDLWVGGGQPCRPTV